MFCVLFKILRLHVNFSGQNGCFGTWSNTSSVGNQFYFEIFVCKFLFQTLILERNRLWWNVNYSLFFYFGKRRVMVDSSKLCWKHRTNQSYSQKFLFYSRFFILWPVLTIPIQFKGGSIVSSWCHMDTILAGKNNFEKKKFSKGPP